MNLMKQKIRKDMIQKRKDLTNQEYQTKSDCICQKIMKRSDFQQANVVYAYFAVRQEVSLETLIQYCLENKKQIALPRVEDENIAFYLIHGLEDVEEGYFHVMEPNGFCEKAPAPDLILVPGVAFTKVGNRLGYGGGFYDRFLKKTPCQTIGIGYDFQLMKELPTEEHDICLDEVITD
ncbi:MAG: 5-formyltetrahydrofolate cyclo-ligase [Eubacterium sp.]|nr:5-formyltetrahydrofolate cyclo-ligase [Eubacterium sp.]